MKYATTCKFCHKPITLTIDDDYARLGDPLKLIKLASCNECADLRVEKRTLEGRIEFTCMMMARAAKAPTGEQLAEARVKLTGLTQKYCDMIGRWTKAKQQWDPECVNWLMEKPDQWGPIVGQLWKMAKQTQLAV